MTDSLPQHFQNSLAGRSRKNLTQHWPLWVALAALWISTGILQYLAARRTAGHLIYTLDDAYIHMAMAKNLARHGVYGVTQFEFSSSSSSPIWTLLLAGFYVLFGVHESFPFILDLLVSSFILVAAYTFLNGKVRSRIVTMLTLLGIVFFTPLPLLISTGMEHPLQILFCIVFLWLSATMIADETFARKPSNIVYVLLLCAALVLTRFESYALVFTTCLLFALRGRWRIALGVAVASILPLLVYQAISVAHGWRWLPNSILVRASAKGEGMFNSMESVVVLPWKSPDFYKIGWNALHGAPYLVVLVGVSLFLLAISWSSSRQLWKREHMLLIAYVAAVLAHVQFGRIGFFFRYDAYLISMGIFVVPFASVGLFDELKRWMTRGRLRAAAGGFMLLFALQLPVPLLIRTFLAFPLIPLASQNIYEQQYQMGLFLHRYYSGRTIAANDIGAISFLADIHLVDLVGLASADIYHLKEEHEFNTARVLQLCDERNVCIAVAYEYWLEDGGLTGFQERWKKVGGWKIQHDVVCGSNVVSFFAVQPSAKRELIENLRSFSKTLPADVDHWLTFDALSDSSRLRTKP